MIQSTKTLSKDAIRYGDSDERVMERIFRTAVTLAAVLRGQRLDDSVATALGLALSELDCAVVELRHAAFAHVVGARVANSVCERARR